jgi:hypothetical protein
VAVVEESDLLRPSNDGLDGSLDSLSSSMSSSMSWSMLATPDSFATSTSSDTDFARDLNNEALELL